VMRFWLDMGVDALRLDAIPYLIEREGTINENLPETHDILKRIRRELDARYTGRVLLAEANQWPSDVRAYFGDGDECHMAFHFPLMPRMFMALRQEDRHAITEILSQTPDIPETCQWALFLRNHDELTLEMVTDEERDYMYSVYAADPQARLNLGIRRRLAPLMENSRRRIELMNTMLFSFPGTPILYYGDEIGMGDNVYLGDRNGVRTPMQWSSDRNGGFSRADPARLYAPPIQDPVYGYQAINVEAQERYPFSLLNWMKRLIAMRKQHRVFGRGALEFVPCSNRKVLAYLRRDDRETILCVVNLSRAVQPAELDLHAFAGLFPVEMAGLTEFPRIGTQPYFLTLSPYAFYWFTVQHEPMQVTARPVEPRDPNAAIVETLPALMVGVDWQNILDGTTRTILEQRALAPFLQRQRWFASKSREIRQARFIDWTMLRAGEYPAFLTFATVDYQDGWTESYFLPFALVGRTEADHTLAEAPARVLARVTGARKGAIVDGLYEDDTCDRLLKLIVTDDEIATKRGSVHGGDGVGDPLPDLAGERKWTRAATDQSNSLAFVNNRYVLKAFRRIEPGPNPEYEMGRFLTTHGFTRIPPLHGALAYLRPTLEAGTLAVLQTAVKHQGSGWDFTIDELRRYYERVAIRGSAHGTVDAGPPASPAPAVPGAPAAPAHFFTAVAQYYLQCAETLGRRTAEMHLTLASGADQAFAPERLDQAALASVADEMARHAEESLTLLARRVTTLHDTARELAEAVLAQRDQLHSRLAELRAADDDAYRIRVHGDYHLGQVLRVEEDWVILDFEGEPARRLAERRAKQSPLKDVAGMIRSFGYAAHAALFAVTVNAPDDRHALESWADTWQEWVSIAFANSYRITIAETSLPSAGTLGPSERTWSALLRAFVLDKALYELGYELNHRPEWIRIPLLGIRKLIG